jgi:hypothetical protein
MFGIDAVRKALVRAALEVLKVDPEHALGVFPVFVDHSSGWAEYVLTLLDRGELIYEVNEAERIIVLHRVLWR